LVLSPGWPPALRRRVPWVGFGRTNLVSGTRVSLPAPSWQITSSAHAVPRQLTSVPMVTHFVWPAGSTAPSVPPWIWNWPASPSMWMLEMLTGSLPVLVKHTSKVGCALPT
jgi:hypothetical protein